MPIYNFECSRCNIIFEKSLLMSQSIKARPSCPACGKRRCTRNYSECVSISTLDATPRTLGTLADRNSDRFSEDKKQHLIEERDKKLNIKKDIELPTGMGQPTEDKRGKPTLSNPKVREQNVPSNS